jgi:hypothetical protein
MKKYNDSNKKPKKNGRKIQLPAKAKSKKLKLKVKETVLPISNYNGGAVFTLDEVNKENDTTTVSEASTYITTVDASKQETQPETVITSLPNKEEVYSKYTETEEEQTSYNNSVVPKANNDGVKTMIIVAGAFALIAFLALVLS